MLFHCSIVQTRLVKRVLLPAIGILLCSSVTVQAKDFSQLFEQLYPSVVVLKTFSSVPAKKAGKGMVSNKSLGSGVVISETGDILTAAHVVHTVDAIHIEFADGEKVLGDVVASDPEADLALIRTRQVPDNLVVATLGDSNQAKIGQQVLVIGAPLGLEYTLSVGYISSRRQPSDLKHVFKRGEFFQVDAAINQGNSGGPLFNSRGELIGIISHIKSLSGGSDGLGFAVTSQAAKDFMQNRGNFWSGLEVIEMTPTLANIMHVPYEYGALVQNISRNSPAARAGIIGGDVRVKINDIELLLGGDVILAVESIPLKDDQSAEQIIDKLNRKKAGEPVKVEVYRRGEVINIVLKTPEYR